MFNIGVLLGEPLNLLPDRLGEIDARIEIERLVPARAVPPDEVRLSSVVGEDSAAGNERYVGHILIAHVWHFLEVVYFRWEGVHVNSSISDSERWVPGVNRL